MVDTEDYGGWGVTTCRYHDYDTSNSWVSIRGGSGGAVSLRCNAGAATNATIATNAIVTYIKYYTYPQTDQVTAEAEWVVQDENGRVTTRVRNMTAEALGELATRLGGVGYATTSATTGGITSVAWPPALPLDVRLRNLMQQRMGPYIKTEKKLERAKDIREERARETLRRVIGQERFKLFLKKGFVSTKAKSGLTYQIFPGGYFTNVFDQFGKQLDRLCVVLKGEYTPTDSLIVRYLMIMNDEENFKKIAIVHRVHTQRPQHQPVERTIQAESLPDIYKRLKHSQHTLKPFKAYGTVAVAS